jgi:hypothetical protein
MDRRLPDGRKMAPHFPSLREEHGATVFMFREDINSHIVPYRVERDNDALNVTLEGDAPEQAKAKLVLKALGGREGRDTARQVAGAVREIARNIAWHGIAVFELARSDKSGAVYPISFTSKRLLHGFGRYVQFVPRADQELWGRRVNVAPSSAIWTVGIPRSLGGTRGFKRILSGLSKFATGTPRFMRRRGEVINRYFDFSLYRREMEIHEARVTKRWGWNRRDFTGQNWTEYALFYRMTTFAWAEAVLRQHIVHEINRLFARLGIAAAISLSGFPAPTEIIKLRDQMASGEISYTKAYDAVK